MVYTTQPPRSTGHTLAARRGGHGRIGDLADTRLPTHAERREELEYVTVDAFDESSGLISGAAIPAYGRP